MKNVIFLLYIVQGDINEKLNILSKPIFGDYDKINGFVKLYDVEVQSESEFGFNTSDIQIDFPSLSQLTITSRQVRSITVINSLPLIISKERLDTIIFSSVYFINETKLLSSLHNARTVKIIHSNIEDFSADFITKLDAITTSNLTLLDSWWTCDCTKTSLLKRQIRGLQALCMAPKKVVGRDFNTLSENDLTCHTTSLRNGEDIVAVEYHQTSLTCSALGFPIPHIVWESPSGQRLDRQFLEASKTDEEMQVYHDTYTLTESFGLSELHSKYLFLSNLTVGRVDKRTAGIYTCYILNFADYINEKDLVENSFNKTEDWEKAKKIHIELKYTPDPATNIAYFILVGSSFVIAFLINLVNVCRYYCDWTTNIKVKRFDPNRYEIPESVRSSLASVYYNKYDFTCQQAFLDALLKSGHAVKRTYENATQHIEINVSYKEFTEKLRENLGNPSGWGPHLGSSFSSSWTRSMQGLRNRLGSFEMPTIPRHLPSLINVSFPSDWHHNWNLRVRISKFSRKWIYGCSNHDGSVDEYKIHNENGRVVITPLQDSDNSLNGGRSVSQPIRDLMPSTSYSTSPDLSSDDPHQELSNLIDPMNSEEDIFVTIIATPTSGQFAENCLYESNV